jgi:4-oxalocrotonate tautomerase
MQLRHNPNLCGRYLRVPANELQTRTRARPVEEGSMPLVRVTLMEGAFTEKQKHDLAARITDVMVVSEGSEAFREVVWVLIEELNRDSWHIGGQPYFGPPNLIGTLARAKTAYEATDGTPTTRADLAAQAPVRRR